MLSTVTTGAAGLRSQNNETRSHQEIFWAVTRFFAPLYVSNECINIRQYCGFSRDNPILRVTLTVEKVPTETGYLLRPTH